MKRNFFKRMALQSSFAARIKHVLPTSMRQRLKRLREQANSRPRLAVGIMLTVAALNLVLLVVVSEKSRQQPLSYRALNPVDRVIPNEQAFAASAPDIPFTLRNFLQVQAMKDSLALLMGKSQRSMEDTLLFIRILERYARLDTAFARQLYHKSFPIK